MEPRHATSASLDALVRAELPRLYRVATRMTGSSGLAEDLVGQTLLLASKGWSGFDGRHPLAWILRIMVHAYFRMASKEKQFEPVEDLELLPGKQDFEAELLDKLTVEAILKAMEHLTPEHRAVVTLCDIEQLPYEEVASALGIPRGTLASRLHRARHHLIALCERHVED